jgi:cob(I)alamin adenosyltransferase
LSPKLIMPTRHYTGTGDDGTTGVMGKGRVRKDSIVIQASGDIDELNSAVGLAIAHTPDDYINRMLKGVQDKLFTIGAQVSASMEGGVQAKSKIGEDDLKLLESQIDEVGNTLPELRKFILPGGSMSSAYLHHARAVARRAERSVVALSNEKKTNVEPVIKKYLNRLSSFLFVAARFMNKKEGIEESNPTYG